MQNNGKNNKSGFNKILNSSFSVKCSFMLAVVTMFSVVFSSFAGVTNNSYAMPDDDNKLPESFTTASVTEESKLMGNSSNFVVYPYYTTDGKQIYCLEHSVGFASNTLYKRGEVINVSEFDAGYGLLYLLSKTYPNTQISEGMSPQLQTWITQTAIWVYLAKVDAKGNDLTNDVINSLKNDTYIYDGNGVEYKDDGTSLYTKYIEPLVNEAYENRHFPNVKIDVSIDNEDFELDSDEKYYKTSLIDVAGSPVKDFVDYSISVKCPKGTILIDSDGNEIETSYDEKYSLLSTKSNVPTSTKFYLKVPKDAISEDNKNIEVNVLGTFYTLSGFAYRSDGAQTVVLVDTNNQMVNDKLDLSINFTPDVPDTKMNVSQTIYFVGLLILLAGVGIVYANVSSKQRQQ